MLNINNRRKPHQTLLHITEIMIKNFYLSLVLLLPGFLLLDLFLPIFIEIKIVQDALSTCVILEYLKYLKSGLKLDL